MGPDVWTLGIDHANTDADDQAVVQLVRLDEAPSMLDAFRAQLRHLAELPDEELMPHLQAARETHQLGVPVSPHNRPDPSGLNRAARRRLGIR